jgi:hypothetical protein
MPETRIKGQKNKIIIISLFIFVNTFFIANEAENSASDIGFSRVLYSQIPAVCTNPYTSYLCVSCGQGPHFNVVGLPAGGASNFMCPTSPAMQTCPLYSMGCQCLSGGTSEKIRDPLNTACTMGGG